MRGKKSVRAAVTRPSSKSIALLLVTAFAYFFTLVAEPDWNVKEAHRSCAGESARVFESMNACTVDLPPNCPCERPLNPWVVVYWLALLTAFGIAAAIVLNAPLLRSAVLVGAAMSVGGAAFGFWLDRDGHADPEALLLLPYLVSVDVAIALLALCITRLVLRRLDQRAATRQAV